MIKRKSLFQLLILVLIVSLLLLTTHTHPYRPGTRDTENHCLLCQLIRTGFIDTICFQLICSFISLITIYWYITIIIKSTTCFSYILRAPPIDDNR